MKRLSPVRILCRSRCRHYGSRQQSAGDMARKRRFGRGRRAWRICKVYLAYPGDLVGQDGRREVGSVHSTDETSNDRGGKGRTGEQVFPWKQRVLMKRHDSGDRSGKAEAKALVPGQSSPEEPYALIGQVRFCEGRAPTGILPGRRPVYSTNSSPCQKVRNALLCTCMKAWIWRDAGLSIQSLCASRQPSCTFEE